MPSQSKTSAVPSSSLFERILNSFAGAIFMAGGTKIIMQECGFAAYLALEFTAGLLEYMTTFAFLTYSRKANS